MIYVPEPRLPKPLLVSIIQARITLTEYVSRAYYIENHYLLMHDQAVRWSKEGNP